VADSDISSTQLKVAQQKCRNDLLSAAVRIGKQHNAAVKKARKEEAELVSA